MEAAQIIESWKRAGSHLIVQWHGVRQGEAWADIVGSYYDLKQFPQSLLAQFGYNSVDGQQFLIDRIIDANSDKIKTPADLAAGQMLAIPLVPPPLTWLA